MKTKRFIASFLAVCMLVMACSTTLAGLAFADDEPIVRNAEIIVSSNTATTGIFLSGTTDASGATVTESKTFDVYEVFTATLADETIANESGVQEEGISYTVSEDFVLFFLQVLDTDMADTTYTYGDYVYTIDGGGVSVVAESGTAIPANFDALVDLLVADTDFNKSATVYVEDSTSDMATLVAQLRTYVLTSSNSVSICTTTGSTVTESNGVETVTTDTGNTLCGYYLVLDSADTLANRGDASTSTVITAGALVNVPTRDSTGSGFLTESATIIIKGSAPTLTKEVWHNDKEGSGAWDTVADYQIGDTVAFRLTATIPSNLDGYTDDYTYVITDTPQDGIIIDTDSIQIYTDAALTQPVVVNGYHTTDKDPVDGSFSLTFDMIGLKKEVLSSINTFYIYYTATIDATAIVSMEYETNTASLEYSTNPYDYTETNTISNDVYVYTFDLDVLKTSGDKTTPLSDATFALYEISIDGTSSKTQIYLELLLDDNNDIVYQTFTTEGGDKIEVPVYVVTNKSGATDVTTNGANTIGTITTNETGRFNIIGLDDATSYVLTEISAPDGYNAADPLSFTITADYDINKSTGEPTLTLGTTVDSEISASGGNVLSTTIVNTSSALLPTTGGMGTTLLTYGGIILMVGAGTALLIKRKKSR